jgi:hypothetical protein
VKSKGKQKGQKLARMAKRSLFAILASFCPFCFPAVFFMVSLNKQKCLDLSSMCCKGLSDDLPAV